MFKRNKAPFSGHLKLSKQLPQGKHSTYETPQAMASCLLAELQGD